jgi:hypothetical protein
MCDGEEHLKHVERAKQFEVAGLFGRRKGLVESGNRFSFTQASLC